MTRVPVVATIRDAYVFTATHLGGIIGLIWVPMVLVTILGFFSSQNLFNQSIEAMASGNAAHLGPALLLWLGYLLSALLLMAIMYVAVVQLALGQRNAPSWAHFAFGAAEWRMLRALLSFVGLVIPVFFLGSILANGVAMRSLQAAPLASLLVYVVMLIFAARFFLLLPAISAMETEPVLRRAWQLSSGNFWPLFAVLMGFVVPLFLLFILLMVPMASQIPPPPATSANLQTQQLAMFVWLRQALPFLWGLLFFVWPLVIGLFSSASVSAWRTLKDKPSVDIES
ncbi:MAG: hypothetical protein RL274_549 [Pseudomonadota bacterium]|jgi:hypothetical protein